MSRDLRRQLPAIDQWLASETGRALSEEFSREEVAAVMRQHLARAREALGNGLTELPRFQSESYAALMREELLKQRLPSLRRAVNATGIVIHTNLGRAPLAPEAVAAMHAAARGYSNLELDLETGGRGSRYRHVESLLCRITGAEAAVVVNNGAGAVMLALDSLADGREVVISRGELVEIGGSFRIPDVVVRSGARMVEVGTTNRTRVSDYAAALSEQTRVLLRVHASNYRIVGFTAKPRSGELAELAHRNGLVFMEDLGSGALVDLSAAGFSGEPTVQQSLAAGADLAAFSGDKLLGGPQAGVIVGRAELIEPMRKNPLLRPLRMDKLSLAALAATLRLYVPPNDPMQKVPVLRMLAESTESVARRAQELLLRLKELPGLAAEVAEDVCYGGGGALPMAEIPTTTVRVRVPGTSAAELARRLRQADPPVVARITRETVSLDPRTIAPEETKDLLAAFRQALA